MSKYLLIETSDSFSSNAVQEHVELAIALKRGGADVSLYLAQNGVLPCRSGADSETLHEALAAGVEVLADDYSLRERGIADADVARGIRPASIDRVVERLAASRKVMFL
ncbi:MAG: DsrE family protein [Steroidobacteraceae bacterium]